MASGQIFSVETQRSEQAVDITAQVRDAVKRAGVENGVCHVMVLHSTAAVAINETADPNIGVDVLTALDRAVQRRGNWLHDRIDDNAPSHIKASILGPSELISVSDGELVLGTWQGIWLFEFDGPRTRKVSVNIIGV
ncbi:MAG TPA: secondary thiamine-phosphate synthase enzyme YjbQ [Myxococcota bacterium]